MADVEVVEADLVTVPTVPDAEPERSLAPFATRPVVVLVLAQLLLQVLTTDMYGLHAGELFQLGQARRLSWGYVDSMPMVAAIYRAMAAVGEVSTGWLHAPAIVAGAVHILLGAAIAREVGGRRWAQSMAALVAAFGPIFLGASRFLGPFTLDVTFLALASLVLLRLVRTRNLRLWPALGLVVGLGLYNKLTVAIWVACMVGALLAGPHRRLVRSRWALGGGLVALVTFSPSLLWLVVHRSEVLTFLSNADGDAGSRIVFVLLPVVAATPVGAFLIARAVGSVRDPVLGAHVGFLVVGTGLAFGVYFLGGAGAQGISLLLPMLSIGAVATEQRSGRRARRTLVVAFVVMALALLPASVSVLPARTQLSSGYGAIFNTNFTIGYHDVARDVARAFRSLPADQQDRTVVVTYTANEAAVLEHWGPGLGLPAPISGENNYGLWGYGDAPDGAAVLVVGFERSEADRFFERCRTVARIGANGRPMDPNERGRLVLWCERARAPWSVLWPELRRYERV